VTVATGVNCASGGQATQVARAAAPALANRIRTETRAAGTAKHDMEVFAKLSTTDSKVGTRNGHTLDEFFKLKEGPAPWPAATQKAGGRQLRAQASDASTLDPDGCFARDTCPAENAEDQASATNYSDAESDEDDEDDDPGSLMSQQARQPRALMLTAQEKAAMREYLIAMGNGAQPTELVISIVQKIRRGLSNCAAEPAVPDSVAGNAQEEADREVEDAWDEYMDAPWSESRLKANQHPSLGDEKS